MPLFLTKKSFDDKVEKRVNKKIQASTEGYSQEVWIESLLTGTPISGVGCDSTYTTYSAQTQAIYRKYRGKDARGNWLVRSVIDTRTSFISGEGLSVHAKKDSTAKWIEKFLIYNKLNGSRFFDYVKSGEMFGNCLFYLKPDEKKQMVRVCRMPNVYEGGPSLCYTPKDISDPIEGGTVEVKEDNKSNITEFSYKDFEYVKLGGAPCEYDETTTKTGLVLTEIDNYDRAKAAMRHNNHLFGKSTPYFECEDENTINRIASLIKKKLWKLGQAFAAKAKMYYVTPDVGAMENIEMELKTLSKAISFDTGIPVHWMGNVDMMSNRSTAESLYETINNATVNERAVWEEAYYNIILKAQEIAVSKGWESAADVADPDFEVKIPLIPFTRMLDYIKALSLTYHDGAISMADYENMLPGLNPFRVRKNKKAEAAQKLKATEQLIQKSNIPNPGEGEEENQDEQRK